jgi:hypothetical protein
MIKTETRETQFSSETSTSILENIITIKINHSSIPNSVYISMNPHINLLNRLLEHNSCERVQHKKLITTCDVLTLKNKDKRNHAVSDLPLGLVGWVGTTARKTAPASTGIEPPIIKTVA